MGWQRLTFPLLDGNRLEVLDRGLVAALTGTAGDGTTPNIGEHLKEVIDGENARECLGLRVPHRCRSNRVHTECSKRLPNLQM